MYNTPECVSVSLECSDQFWNEPNIRHFTEMQETINIAQSQLKKTETGLFRSIDFVA